MRARTDPLTYFYLLTPGRAAAANSINPPARSAGDTFQNRKEKLRSSVYRSVKYLRLTPTPRLEACHAAEHEVAVGEGRGGGAALRARGARVAPVLAARDGDHVVARAKSLLRHGLV